MEHPKPSILYVDDEAGNLRAFKAAFRRDYKIYLAESAKEGYEMLKANPVHLIITDQRMPEMTGVEFLESLNNEFTEEIRMILTGYSDVEAVIRAINTGKVYRYITKPWDEDEMRMIINSAFKYYTLQQDNKRLTTELFEKVNMLERTMKLFQKYVPEDVVKENLAAQEGRSILDGETRNISIMFTDIRNFTSLSSRLEAEEVVDFLNDYFSIMNAVIKKHHGTVNKFMGDGILALFGAPVSYLENQENAVLCALEMLEKVSLVNDKYAESLGQQIQIGIGVNTGKAVVGNIGSEDRVEYTVIGDTVNVAARIESLTKNTPDSAFISHSTYEKVKHIVEAKELEPMMVKGKEEPLQVYQVLRKKH